ncbi:hypothetical protein CHRYSEOSP005_00900 [Chryseobacterium sp. Alg-005]|uniref:DUF1835 domain-containing protein n=1 Tax=Chryseobacterium sp. Alg-005 TaxID=3159516 RepID=UPI003555AF10
MKKVFHILNGDCLAVQLKETSIDGKVIICREALISGDVKADSLRDFWELRAESISKDYSIEKEIYYEKTVSEFLKILDIPEGAEVNLWFEDDLFCQTNMWFCLFLLSEKENIKIYRVFPQVPSLEDHWKGFSLSDSEDLKKALQSRVECKGKDIELGVRLWKAYQNQDKSCLTLLSETQSGCFNLLKTVVDAYLNTFPENQTSTNPKIYIRELVDSGITDFNAVFEKFQQKFGIYGYGDLQVKKMYDTTAK